MTPKQSLTAAAIAVSALSLATMAHAADITRTYDVTASDFVDGSGNLGSVQAFNASYTLTFDPSSDITTPTMAGLTVNSNTLPYGTSYTYYHGGSFPDTLTLATQPGSDGTGPSFGDNNNTYGTFIGGATAANPFSYGVVYTFNNDVFSAKAYDVTASPLAPVPEASTWAYMIFGLGGIGLIMARAKKTMGFRLRDGLTA